MKNYHKRIIFISVILLAMFYTVTPVRATTWKFKSASENEAPWNKGTDDFRRGKTGSENSVLKMRLSGQVNKKNGEPASVSGDSSDKKENTGRKDSNENRETVENTANVSENKVKKKQNDKDSLSEDNIKRKVDPDDWRLILVNKQNPIPDDYEAVMIPINGGVTIREEIKEPLEEMFEAASKEGITLQACSGYRSHAHQQELFDRKIRTYTRSGLSYLDAFRIGSYSVIIPGTSEHELGMALDIVTPGYTSLNEGFEGTAAGRWLKNNSFKYGFILRYPKGKEYITGITYEPWHFRYVGKEAAIDIRNSGLTLEEYLEELEVY